MFLKLITFFLVSCLVTLALSQFDHDKCSFAPEKKVDQRISLQKCEEYKKFTYEQFYTAGSCKPQKSYKCQAPTFTIGIRKEARENEFPHMAHVGYDTNGEKSYTCGGTLISENFVMTAAHCKSDKRGKAPNIVRLNSVSEDSPQAIFRNIAEIIVHPDFKTNEANDLALLKLSMKVKFQMGKLMPACLWTNERLEINTAISTGWGTTTGFAESASDNLMKAKLNLVDISKCKKAMGAQKAQDEYHICTTTDGGRDFCIEDTGSLLQVTQPDNPCMSHIIGVMSKGQPCGVSNSYGVYVKVSKFINWIERIVWNA